MGAEKALKVFITLNVLLAITLVLLVVGCDPCFIFWKRLDANSKLVDEQIVTNCGILEAVSHGRVSFIPDTLLLGSSEIRNYYCNSVEKAVRGEKCLKISQDGAFPYECSIFLKKFLKNKSVRNVVYCIDLYGFQYPFDCKSTFLKEIFPYKIYDNKMQSLTCSSLWKAFFKSIFNQYQDLNNLYYFFNKKPIQKAFDSFHKTINFQKKFICKSPEAGVDYSYLNDTLKHHLLDFISDNEHINFYIVVNPYSTLWYLDETVPYRASDSIYRALFFITSLVKATENLKNCKIFAFNDCTFTRNLGNYWDSLHFYPEVNRYILYCISNDKHLLTLTNLQNYKLQWLNRLNEPLITNSKPDKFENLILE